MDGVFPDIEMDETQSRIAAQVECMAESNIG